MNKQTLSRAWHTFRLHMILDSEKRADYIRKHKVFRGMGTGCSVVSKKVPLCPRLISVGNNVHLAAGVLLSPHDAIHLCLNRADSTGDFKYREKIGCIEIGDNVFVGANSTILYDVKIGSNVIIGAGSLVNKDIPDNSVAAGTPAKVIGTFNDFAAKRRAMQMYPETMTLRGHAITAELEEWCWNDFKSRR